ncbi:TPA: cyclic nucleotide-binding domain-containing protein [Candidatus Spyradomonas excrementavium]|nr:cyclic nucleotide-binding domain-containing protein [Candidatus Spyradomonas excrementavium]
MEKIAATKRHLEKLKRYGLENIEPGSINCYLFSSGEFIVRQEDEIEGLRVITKGKAKACRTSPNGKNLIFCYYVQDGIIGEIELITGVVKTENNIIAVGEVECLIIDDRVIKEELKTNIKFLTSIGEELSKKMLKVADNFVSSALLGGEQRLCSYILQNSTDNYFYDNLTDVSYSISMSYRHMFRLLKQLCKEKILKKEKRGYTILDKKQLKKYTEKE